MTSRQKTRQFLVAAGALAVVAVVLSLGALVFQGDGSRRSDSLRLAAADTTTAVRRGAAEIDTAARLLITAEDLDTTPMLRALAEANAELASVAVPVDADDPTVARIEQLIEANQRYLTELATFVALPQAVTALDVESVTEQFDNLAEAMAELGDQFQPGQRDQVVGFLNAVLARAVKAASPLDDIGAQLAIGAPAVAELDARRTQLRILVNTINTVLDELESTDPDPRQPVPSSDVNAVIEVRAGIVDQLDKAVAELEAIDLPQRFTGVHRLVATHVEAIARAAKDSAGTIRRARCTNPDADRCTTLLKVPGWQTYLTAVSSRRESFAEALVLWDTAYDDAVVEAFA